MSNYYPEIGNLSSGVSVLEGKQEAMRVILQTVLVSWTWFTWLSLEQRECLEQREFPIPWISFQVQCLLPWGSAQPPSLDRAITDP